MTRSFSSRATRSVRRQETAARTASADLALGDAEPGRPRLVAFFDDSGNYVEEGAKGNTPALVICGFVAREDQWGWFDRDWREVLALPEFDLEHFHMREVNRGRGRFERFIGNQTLKEQLFDRLQRIIKVRTIATFGGTVEVDAWDTVNQDFQLAETYEKPVVLAGRLAIHRLLRWTESLAGDEQIAFIFDQGMRDWGLLRDSVYQAYNVPLTTAEMRSTTPIQACDLLAWELHRAIGGATEVVASPYGTITLTEAARPSFEALKERFGRVVPVADGYQIHTPWFILNTEDLRFVCEYDGVPKREASERGDP
jgi:hypothetical protein